MAKQFRNTSSGFDSDLDAILNRVYGQTRDDLERGPNEIRQSFNRHVQDSQDLKQALAELRDRREKSQSAMRMKEEVEYLKQEIRRLKDLRHQIESLRARLESDHDRR